MTAWEFFRETKACYGQVFITWVYQKNEEGIWWLLNRPEKEAIDIIDEFCLEQMGD